MPFQVRIARRVADEDVPNLPHPVQKALLGDPEEEADEGKLGALAENPELGKPLTGILSGLRQITVSGRYRAIYKIFQDKRVVTVLLVGIRREGHRSNAATRLDHLLRTRGLRDVLGKESAGLLDPGTSEGKAPQSDPEAPNLPHKTRRRTRR